MTNRQESRLITLTKICIWKIKQEINEIGKDKIHIDEIQNFKDVLVSIIEKKLKIIHTQTQIDYFVSETSPARLEYTMKQIIQAVKWEIATSPEIYKFLNGVKYANDTPLSKKDIIEMKETIARALGVKNCPDTFDREKQVKYYRDEIVKALETTEDRIRHILDDIKKLCEFDSILGAIHNCSYVSSLPKRDKHVMQEKRRKFERTKKSTIEGLKFLKLPYDKVEAKQYIAEDEKYDWINYQTTLKHIKQVLYDDLTLICGTAKRKAEEMAKILDYI